MCKLVNYPDLSQIINFVEPNIIIFEVKRHFSSNSEFRLDLVSPDSTPNSYFFTYPDGEGGRNRENEELTKLI